MLGIGYILGFQCLFLVFIAAIGFLIRRKWRLSVARKAEIKRLLVLAAEEAARVELEATTGYGYGYSHSHSPVESVATPAPAAPISTNYQCAVCYSPTTTRCARCKAVRYWYSFFFFFLWPNLEILTNLLIWFYNCLIWGYCIL